MKKILSVFLAVLMMFSVLSIGASAEDVVVNNEWFTSSGKPASTSQAVLMLNLNGGSLKLPTKVYDRVTGDFVLQENYKASENGGNYYMVPQDSNSMLLGNRINLPIVTPPEGKQFNGWYCYNDNNSYAANGSYTITKVGDLTMFIAEYITAEIEEDTLGNILGIMMKVVGTVLGVFLYGDAEQGNAMIDELLGGILGDILG